VPHLSESRIHRITLIAPIIVRDVHLIRVIHQSVAIRDSDNVKITSL